jgi:hypothetical protein
MLALFSLDVCSVFLFFLDIIAIELLGVMFVQELVDDDGVVVVDLCSKK